jgi:plastocyanin
MRRRAAVATAIVASAALASCADDGPSSGQGIFVAMDAETCPPIEGYAFPVADHGSAEVSGATTIEVDGGDSFFAPTCALDVPAGTITLRVTNSGRQLHNVSISDQAIDVDVPPGETIDVEVEVEAGAAPIAYVCKYHRTAGMVGALVAEV